MIVLTILHYNCQTGNRTAEENSVINYAADDRFEFDPKECNVAEGKWVFNRSYKPLYTDRSCPYLDRQVSCVKNGREDSDYRKWEWQLDDCILPRLNEIHLLYIHTYIYISLLLSLLMLLFLHLIFLKDKVSKYLRALD